MFSCWFGKGEEEAKQPFLITHGRESTAASFRSLLPWLLVIVTLEEEVGCLCPAPLITHSPRVGRRSVSCLKYHGPGGTWRQQCTLDHFIVPLYTLLEDDNSVSLMAGLVLHSLCIWCLSLGSSWRLTCCGFTAASCADLASVFSNNSSLQFLEFWENELGDLGVNMLCEGLKHPNCNLENLT